MTDLIIHKGTKTEEEVFQEVKKLPSRDVLPPIKKKKGFAVYKLSCGHICQSIVCNICPTCAEDITIEEKKDLPHLLSYLCWDCQSFWIGNIPSNKNNGDLECPNCGAINLISKNKNSRNIPGWSKLRHECFKRDGYKCVECGRGKPEVTLHCDHIQSKVQEGYDELDNLQTLCQACNLAKSNRKWEAQNA